jgi:hypothetical protein
MANAALAGRKCNRPKHSSFLRRRGRAGFAFGMGVCFSTWLAGIAANAGGLQIRDTADCKSALRFGQPPVLIGKCCQSFAKAVSASLVLPDKLISREEAPTIIL